MAATGKAAATGITETTDGRGAGYDADMTTIPEPFDLAAYDWGPDDHRQPAAERAVRAVMRIALRHGSPLTRAAAEQIAEAVLGCADTDIHSDYMLADDVYENMRDGAMDGLRESMRNHLAITALKDGYLLTALPHEITDRPPDIEGQFCRRIRLIAPARKAPSPLPGKTLHARL